MTIKRLDHVNLRTTRLDEMVAWYVDILGLANGPRPNFPFAGAWLYAGEHAVVHLISVDNEACGSETELKLEHFAFSAEDAEAFEARLTSRGETFQRSEITALKLAQYNVFDPDGNHIHVDFQIG
ncbi:MAG: VOC family protein [Pseudomonadota bacterium]